MWPPAFATLSSTGTFASCSRLHVAANLQASAGELVRRGPSRGRMLCRQPRRVRAFYVVKYFTTCHLIRPSKA